MSEATKTESQTSSGPYGILAEYESHTELLAAARKVRDEGFARWDCYSPFPVHGIDPAMGIKRTKLPYIVMVAGITGCLTAIGFQYWANSVDYAFKISGKPFFSIPANIPITFELTVLFSALTTFFSMLVLNGLPQHSSPLDRVRRFARASDDRFFVVIEASDPKYDGDATRDMLEATGPVAVELVPDDTSSGAIPKSVVLSAVVLIAVSLIPFGLFAAARVNKTDKPQYHVVPNMDFQKYYKAQRGNEFFAASDGRAMRAPVEGTVAVGELRDDDHFYAGKVGDAWALSLPEKVEPSAETMKRGKERFGIYCAPCHGLTGDGDGMVHRRAAALAEGTWVKPTNIADEKIKAQPIGQLFNTVSAGIRNMPGYADQISTADRWAILLYVRALQESQGGTGTPN